MPIGAPIVLPGTTPSTRSRVECLRNSWLVKITRSGSSCCNEQALGRHRTAIRTERTSATGAWLPPGQRIRPALTWFLVGAVIAALVGWLGLLLAGEIVESEAERIAKIKNDSALAAYSLAIAEAEAEAIEDQVTLEIARLLMESDSAPGSNWANAFRSGWADGWNDALDAMGAASLEAGAAADSPELAALDAAQRRRDPS